MLCVQDNNGEWGIPKGHIREGETPEEGAYREFTEETQIILNKEIIFSHKVRKNKKGIFHVFYCLGDKKITPHIGHEHINSGYYNITDLPPTKDPLSVDRNLYQIGSPDHHSNKLGELRRIFALSLPQRVL